MSADYLALASAWSGLAGNTTVKKLQAINATLSSGEPSDLPLNVVSDFVRNSGKLPGIASFVNNPPASPDATALLAANYLLVLILGGADSIIPAASVQPLLTILDNISADPRTGVGAAAVTAFNNICIPTVPWWQANGFNGPVTLFDLMAAGNLF
jgi:hypothetical protein